MSTFKLRPHHLLCSRFFAGSGYSPEFVDNMKIVLAEMESDPEVTLTCGADIVCRACPNLKGGVCSSADKVPRYDAAVMDITGLCNGGSARFSELRRTADEKIIFAGRLGEVCGDCEWMSICASQLAQLVNKNV